MQAFSHAQMLQHPLIHHLSRISAERSHDNDCQCTPELQKAADNVKTAGREYDCHCRRRHYAEINGCRRDDGRLQ